MLSLPLLLASLLFTNVVYARTNFAGVTASNSVSGTSSYACRSQAQWNTMASDLRNNGFGSLRILGFDCNALEMASSAAASAGITVLAGIYYDGPVSNANGNIDADVQTFINAARKYGAGRYVGLTVGNEVNDSPANIINKVNQVRSTLRSAGISTPVSTVHNWVTVRSNSLFCQGDFVGANAHAFYDGNVNSGQTGDFVFKTVVPQLHSLCPGKKLIITESGWPSRGNSNGAAQASVGDERNALLNLNCACRDDTSVSVYAFEYDDQNWKPSNENERSFGIFGKFNLGGDVFAPC
ncbi:glycoside hydrolase superfamily [Panaeolus papilionaceus]|nr:glycoside hydrolase superfamily [Panaeolus papilionaceus]